MSLLQPQNQASVNLLSSQIGLARELAHGTGQSRPNIVKAASSSLADASARFNGGSPQQARSSYERVASLAILARQGHA